MPSDTSTTPQAQPTPVPSIPTKPASTATEPVVPMSTESLSTESTPVQAVTDYFTTMNFVPSNPTNPSVSIDNRVPSIRGGESAVIAAVVLAVLVVVILAVLLFAIVAVVLRSRGRSRNFANTHSSLHMGISNKAYGMYNVNSYQPLLQ